MNSRLLLILLMLGLTGALVGYHLGKERPESITRSKAAKKTSRSEQSIPMNVAELFNRLESENLTSEARYETYQRLNKVGVRELEDLARQLLSQKDLGPNSRLDDVMNTLIARDGSTALKLIETHYPSHKLSHAYWDLIQSWGRSEPLATLHFLQDYRGTEYIDMLNASTNFLSEWASRDPEGALEAWLSLPEPKLAGIPNAEYCAECLLRSAAETPDLRDKALDLLSKQPHSESRASALAGVLANWVRQDSFKEASSWMVAQDFEKEERIEIATTLAQAAIQIGQLSAADWLTEQLHTEGVNEHERATALHDFTEEWARWTPECLPECAEWLTKQEPSPETDGAIRGFLTQVKHVDPEAGFHWTREIRDPKGREKEAKELWNAWRRHAPESAKTFVTKLEEQEREWLGVELSN